jgi:homoserine O-succinyltransferase
MPLLLDTVRSGSTVGLRGRNCLTISLVNNMPDTACEATERQFIDLLRAATSGTVVRLKLFSIADVPRAEEVRQELGGRYRDVADLWDTPLDGLIVTGTEPRAANLQDEPYWAALSRLVDWARGNTTSAIWSCLAAHAAVLHVDGVGRQPLENKLSGVFDCEAAADHPLLDAVGPRLRVPHSRLNDLPEPALRACGYRVLSRSAVAGVDAFLKEDDDSPCSCSFRVIRNTRPIHCCANTAVTSAASCAASAIPIRSRRKIISTTPRISSPMIFACAPWASGAAISSAISRWSRWRLRSKTPGATRPSAFTGTGSIISRPGNEIVNLRR